MSPTRYPSRAHRNQTFRRGEAHSRAVRETVASWVDGIPPADPVPVVTYAADLLPTTLEDPRDRA
ncbi:hypothetical protein, partial [Microbacterium sp. B24]|uniref:hypothetical protein n=1 Tax=Microbacterium sp. B24 TaxID=95616 RepID=UPI00055DBB76